MNINAIKKICMQNKRCAILNVGKTGGQWISNGFAAYLVDSTIDLNVDNILNMFDVAEDAKNKPIVTSTYVTENEEMYYTHGVSEKEERLEDVGAVVYGGELYRALLGGEGLLFVNVGLLKPVKTQDYCEFYLRRVGEKACVAVYADLFASALIRPLYAESAADLCGKLRDMLAHKVYGQDAQQDAQQQTSMFD